jgi:hypothetical protein
MKKSTLTLFFFLTVLFSYSQVNLNNGLMAYYPFNGNANDASGNNNNPVFNNATLTSDRSGTPNAAYHFNGINNYMQIPNNSTLNFANKMSIVAWVKVTGFYAGTCHGNRIVMKGNTDNTPGNYYLTFDDNAYTNGQNCFITAPDVLHQNFYGYATNQTPGGYTPHIQTNQWYSVIFTSDGTTTNLYINCELKGSGPVGAATFTNAADLFFGNLNNPLYPYWFNGDLDEVRIYNRALNIAEVNVLGGCAATSACVPTFQKRYGGNKGEISYGVTPSTDGGSVLAAYTNSFGSGGYDGYLQKIDKNGTIVWNKAIGGAGNDYFYRIKQTLDGGYIAVGNTASFGGAASGVAWLVKTDANGNVQWAKKYDDGNAIGSIGWDVVATSDGGFALTGTNRFAAGTGNVMVLKTDNNGVVVWAKSFDSGNTDESLGIVEDADSLVIAAHQYGQSSSFYDLVVMKLNKNNGNVVWAKNYDIENKSNRSYEIFKTSAGYSLSVSEDISFSATFPDQVILNTDNSGNPLSLRKLTNTAARAPQGYLPTNDGGYITALVESNNSNADIDLIKVNSAGTIQWTKKYGGAGMQSSLAIRQTADGGYILTGYATITPAVSDSSDMLVIKMDSLGNTPGCNTSTSGAVITIPAYTLNASFAWSSITNLTFGTTSITPSSLNVNPLTTTLCSVVCLAAPDTIIINDYTSVTALDKCKNILTVGDGAKYKTGDTVLLIQIKGTVIDSSNTAAFGTITNYKNAGNYEFNYIKSRNGNLVELKNVLTRQYDLPDGKVQLIRVPFYQKLDTNSVLTCQQWNGSTGGVLVFNVADTLNLKADIDVSGKGFRGTPIDNHNSACHELQYFYNSTSANAGFKGEGIFELSFNNTKGRGKAANAGGGGNGANAGGGGGANFGSGGLGGKEFLCSAQPQSDNPGLGGVPVAYTGTANKIFLGGAGGTGDENDNTGSAGGNGGGIVIITAGAIKSNTNKIISKGITPAACTGPNCADGQGGGGAGGTAILNVTNFVDNTIVNTTGGDGGSYSNTNSLAYYGPGGGGGGGALWLKSSSLPVNVTPVNAGGANGTWLNTAQAGGAVGGTSGGTLFNVAVPVDNVLFKPTFDSAKLHIKVLTCTNFKFWGLTDAITSQIVKWQWSLGDGYTDTTQIFSHNYITPGTYPVKLLATDIYGCVATFKVDLTVLCRCEAIKLISPNPTRDIITVSGLGCGKNTLVLYTMLGQKITEVSGDNASETINVSHLAKGMYIVRIINKDKIIKHLKVEKM